MSFPSFETSPAQPSYKQFGSWEEAWKFLAKEYVDKHSDDGRFNPDVIIPAASSIPDPQKVSKFTEASHLSFDLNADRVYRDGTRDNCALQVRVYEPTTEIPSRVTDTQYDEKVYYTQFNYHNPVAGPQQAIKHLVDIFKLETPLTKGPDNLNGD